ncbi:MAG TPA: energy transducer TonB [Rhodothermales bacterium]
MKRQADISLKEGYRVRMLAAIAGSLLGMIILVRYWPVSDRPEQLDLADVPPGETIQIEEIRPTRQSSSLKPPPPPPVPPIVVADDVILDQEELDLTDAFLPIDEGIPDPGAQPSAGDAARVEYEGPKPIRVVEPEYTRAAHRSRVRAEVVVGVRVDETGRVQEAWVMKRFLLQDDEQPPVEVESLGYGLEEAAMAAAERCVFRPARRNGKPVPSETTLGFGFGV